MKKLSECERGYRRWIKPGTSKEVIAQLRAECERLEGELVETKQLLAYKNDTANTFMGQVKKLQVQCAEMKDAAGFLWTIICNASGGDWTKESDDWQKAAVLGRETYHNALSTTAGTAILARLTALESVVEQCEKALLPFECETCNGTKLFTFECQGCLTGEGECTCANEEPSPCPQCQQIDGIKAMYAARDEALAAIRALKEQA